MNGGVCSQSSVHSLSSFKASTTSDSRVLNPCCQGGAHAFNFYQSQVKSHEGFTCGITCVSSGSCFREGRSSILLHVIVCARFRQG